MRIKLEEVNYIPKELSPGILYVSKKFGAAAHLCPCGCGSKIRTPISPTDWSLEETESGPSLFPSIGNWQQACQSHYWINKGEIKWANKWTPGQITTGRLFEQKRNIDYYEHLEKKHKNFIKETWGKIRNTLVKRL